MSLVTVSGQQGCAWTGGWVGQPEGLLLGDSLGLLDSVGSDGVGVVGTADLVTPGLGRDVLPGACVVLLGFGVVLVAARVTVTVGTSTWTPWSGGPGRWSSGGRRHRCHR